MHSRLGRQLVAGTLVCACLALPLKAVDADGVPPPAPPPPAVPAAVKPDLPKPPAPTAAEQPAGTEQPATGDPTTAPATKPDAMPCGEDVTPSAYKDLPKPFESMKAGEKKPMKVWYDAKTQRIFIEGRFCLSEGGLEFLAVADGGKTHESLLELYCRPQDVLYAMLVCTYQPNNNLQGVGGENVPAGDPVYIYVEYQAKNGKTVRRRIEDFAHNKLSDAHMKDMSFAFTGSAYTKDPETGKSVYLADMEKDLVTCFRTAWSVFNTPLIQGDNDTVYSVDKTLTPAVDTKCVMVIAHGRPILKNEIDDNPKKVPLEPHANDGKMAQFAEQNRPMEGSDDFTPGDPKKPHSLLETPGGD